MIESINLFIYFPFVSQVDLKHKHQKEGSQEIELGIDLSEFYLSVEWDIISVPALRKEAFYSCCEEVSYFSLSLHPSFRSIISQSTSLHDR